MVHCWADKTENCVYGSEEWVDSILNPGTCMLEDGHEGPHEWTQDNEIGVSFEER